MPKNARPRKRHVARAGPSLPILYRFDAATDRDLKLDPHLALTALVNGAADSWHFNALAARCGVAWVQAADRWKDDLPDHAAAQAALRSVRERRDRTGKLGATGDEFRAIGRSISLADDYQGASTRKQLLTDHQRHIALQAMAG